jgi:hypothetical protein
MSGSNGGFGNAILQEGIKEIEADANEEETEAINETRACICEPGLCAPPKRTMMTCYECEVCWTLIEDARRRSGLLGPDRQAESIAEKQRT